MQIRKLPEEHMAKLSVNAMIGLWARRADVICSVRSSSCQLDGPGANFTQSYFAICMAARCAWIDEGERAGGGPYRNLWVDPEPPPLSGPHPARWDPEPPPFLVHVSVLVHAS